MQIETTKEGMKNGLASLPIDEILAYLNLVEQTVIEILSEHGMTTDELNARRKSILDSENKAIDDELKKLG